MGAVVQAPHSQHSTALGTAAPPRASRGAVANKSLHSIWMLLPPCFPSVKDSKDGEDPPHSDDATCQSSPLPHTINAVMVNSTASATAGTTDLPSFTASPDQTWFSPTPLLKVRSGITPPHSLSKAAWPGHCLQAGCALSRWDVLPLQTHCSPKPTGLGSPTAFSSGCYF